MKFLCLFSIVLSLLAQNSINEIDSIFYKSEVDYEFYIYDSLSITTKKIDDNSIFIEYSGSRFYNDADQKSYPTLFHRILTNDSFIQIGKSDTTVFSFLQEVNSEAYSKNGNEVIQKKSNSDVQLFFNKKIICYKYFVSYKDSEDRDYTIWINKNFGLIREEGAFNSVYKIDRIVLKPI